MIYRQNLAEEFAKEVEELSDIVKNVIRSGNFVLSSEVDQFETEFAQFLGAKKCVGVASGFDALFLSLKAAGIGEGDEVVTTAFTAFPTIAAILGTGAKPVFCDINIDTFLLDCEKINSSINSKTKAVIPVHIFGNVFDVNKLIETIPKGVYVIEDACQAHGSQINGEFAGTHGHLGCFSFYPTKNLGGIGDSGAIICNEKNFYKELKKLRTFGMDGRDNFSTVGFNSRLDEIQASVLRFRLKKLDHRNKKRNLLRKFYEDNIDFDFYMPQKIPTNVYSCSHVFSIRLKDNKTRNRLEKYLHEKGIQTNIYYPQPQNLQPACSEFIDDGTNLENTQYVCDRILALPMNSNVLESNSELIVESLRNFRKL